MASTADMRDRFQPLAGDGKLDEIQIVSRERAQVYLDYKREAFDPKAALAASDGQPSELMAEGGEAKLFVVGTGTLQVVVKQFYEDNLVSHKAGGDFAVKQFQNGVGLTMAAARLDEISAPHGIRIFAPVYAENNKTLITPLYDRPNLEHLGFSADGYGDVIPSKQFQTFARDFLINHPGFDSECSRALSRLIMSSSDAASLRLKESDFLIIDAEFADASQKGIAVPGKSQLLRATFLVIDLH